MASIMRFDITKVSLSYNLVNKGFRIEFKISFIFLLFVFTSIYKISETLELIFGLCRMRVSTWKIVHPAFGILINNSMRMLTRLKND